MFSCQASPYHPSSSSLHTSTLLPAKSPLFFTSNSTQQANFLIFATLPTSTQSTQSINYVPLQEVVAKPCSKVTFFMPKLKPVELQENCQLYQDKTSRKFHDFLETVVAAPTPQKNEAVDKLQRDGRLQTISEFNHLLMALVTADEFELASKLNSNLSSFGLAPDSWTYSILVTCYCKMNEPKEAKTVLDRMLENGLQPNVATFTTLINSFCQNGRLQIAYEVFDIMTRIGREPTINTYNCLLKGLCYVGRVEAAYDLLMNIKKSLIKPDIYTYTVVMDGFCKVGRSNEALELLDEALDTGLTPNAVTYNTLFNGYFKEGRPLDGIGLLQQMKERNCTPDYISYCTLLHGLLKWGKTRAALGMYKEMVGLGFQVDERMTNTLMRGLCKSSRKEDELLKDVHEVFEKMKNEDCAIYSCTYDLVIEAFCNGKENDKAFEILDEMIKTGYSPRTFTFNLVVRALCLDGEVDKALSVLMLIHKDRMASRIPFNILINGLNGQGRSLDACTVYGLAVKKGVVPQREPRKCWPE
ncbi:Pentatricopeptide repeat-containing protein [Forsythia ovata]|uniref:Pentatricopeptide repeat-containing protein n=1 Tax=Forsythia ovata TaxID=205694 RepID=A0ABD1SHV9_9LAMI